MYSLLIDTSHQKNAIGIFGTDDQWLIYNTFKKTPYEGLSYEFKNLLNDSKIPLNTITKIFIPCAPGSSLGIRVTKMFVEGLMAFLNNSPKVFEYNGLFLSALSMNQELKKESYLITENGRNHWSLIHLTELINPTIASIEEADLNRIQGQCYYIEQAKKWKSPPDAAKKIDYMPEKFSHHLNQIETFNIDHNQLISTESKYKKWNT